MSDAVIAVALLWVAASGTAVVLTRDPLRQAFTAGFFGLALAFLYLSLQSGDVALSQIVVGAIALPLIVLLSLAAPLYAHDVAHIASPFNPNLNGTTVVGTNSTTCVPAACVITGLTADTSYTVVVTANGDHVTYNNSLPSTPVPFVTTSVGPTNSPPPSGVTASSLAYRSAMNRKRASRTASPPTRWTRCRNSWRGRTATRRCAGPCFSEADGSTTRRRCSRRRSIPTPVR